MTISRTQITKPENHQDFERFCAILWAEKLGDPNLQRYGRSGTAQRGIDIIGIRDSDPRKRVGIQCKLKSGTAALTETEMAAEFEKALAIDPPLTEFHIVTTADRDPNLQDVADALTIKQLEKGRRIRVVYWAWQAITDELGQYPNALLVFDDSYGVFARQTLERIDEGIDLQQSNQEALLARLDRIETRLPPSDSTTGVVSALERHLDAEIDGYREANNGGSPTLALAQFGKLLERVQADAVSGRILFRIKANIGSCHLRLGDEAEAIKWLLEAYDHAPSEPKAIANKAFAHLLLEDFDTVLAMGRANLETEAADEMLSSHVIQAARFATVEGDPLNLVPEKDRDTEGVLIALALFQRSQNDRGWKATAAMLVDRFPKERLARQLSAEAMLDDVVGESGYVDHANLSTADLERLQMAAQVLADLWSETMAAEGEYDEADIALCGNLILAYRAQADFSSAMAALRYALTISEIDDDFLVRAAATAMEAGDPVVEEILPRLPASQSKNLLLVQVAVTKGDWKALSELDSEDESSYPAVEWQLCRTAIRLGKLWDMPDAECLPSLTQIVGEVGSNVRASVIVAQFSERKGSSQLAEKAWANALSSVNDDTHISGRMMAAMYAYKHRLWSDVASLMVGHVALDHDGEELRSLAAALVQERPIKQRAVEFFESLPSEIRTLPRYRYLQGMLHFNRGDLPTAERIFGDELAEKPSLELLSMMVMALRRQNRSPEIPELLARYDVNELDGTPAEKMVIAHELRRVGRERDAIDFAYPVLRANPNDPDVNVSFAVLVFSMENFGDIVSVTKIDAGNWVKLTREGDKDYTFVVEEGKDDPTGGYLTPAHPLASLALGQHVGDTLTLPQQFGDPVIWTVADIKHRYLHAFHEILENFQTKFPTAKGLFSVTMKDNDLSSIINQLKLIADRSERAVDLHVKSGFPIQLIAGLFKENPIELAGGIAAGDDIRTCVGNAPEQLAAYDLIRGHDRKGVVLDAHAAWTVATLDLFDLVEQLLGPIYIPQSVRDSLILFRGFDDIQKYPAMSLVHRGGQTYRHERDRETDEARQAYVTQQLDKIEAACIVSPVVAPNDLDPLESMLLEECGERGLDPIFLTIEGRILVTEDLTYRQLAHQTRRVNGLWLQALLMCARAETGFAEDSYSDAVANLAILRHGPVAIDTRLLEAVVTRDPSKGLRTFEALARYIGGLGADYLSHARVVHGFIRASARDHTLDRLVRQKAISILLRNLLRHAQANWPWVLEIVERGLDALDREYVYGWLRGHFLNPNILYGLRQRVNAFIVAGVLAEMRRDSGTSSIETILGGANETTAAVAAVSEPPMEQRGRPAIPRRRRRRKRRG